MRCLRHAAVTAVCGESAHYQRFNTFNVQFFLFAIGLIIHEGAAVYNVFMRWRAVNLHWDVQSYDKAKDMEETSTGHSSLAPRTLWLPLVTFGLNDPLHPTQLGPQPWTCVCLAPFCPRLLPRNNLSQDSDSGEVVIRVTSV